VGREIRDETIDERDASSARQSMLSSRLDPCCLSSCVKHSLYYFFIFFCLVIGLEGNLVLLALPVRALGSSPGRDISYITLVVS
jgi:hypothetical protein